MLLQSLLRPVLTPIMRGIFDPAQSVSAAWSPLSLWPDGIASPGMWISPRDLTSEWQDYTGTTPVAVPGTVADSANPVGLALDIRAGAPDVLGPELVVNGDFSDGSTGWTLFSGATISGGKLIFDQTIYSRAVQSTAPLVAGTTYKVTIVIDSISVGMVGMQFQGGSTVSGPYFSTAGSHDCYLMGVSGNNTFYFTSDVGGSNAVVSSISIKEVPGNHMLQSTSAARPLMSAYDGQALGPGDTYSSTGYPIYQKYDGTDDGMATAAFPAGTLINGMDCMIAVRRDSAASVILGLSDIARGRWFAYADSGSGSVCFDGALGTPTVWVDNIQLTGGTAVTRDTLNTAMTVGDWHIMEFRDMAMSGYDKLRFGDYPGFLFSGARGDIMLYPSTASTEDKDAARQYLADYYGVTLP